MANYNEQFLGDLSDDFRDAKAHEFFPGKLVLFTGSNIVEGSTTNSPLDRDFFTFDVPSGFKVSNIILQDYQWGNGDQSASGYGNSYFAMRRGNGFGTITSSAGYIVSKLIDDVAGDSEVGDNLLSPSVGNVRDVAGKGGPGELGQGSYVVWYQETGQNTTYAFDVQLEATEPANYGQVQFDPDSFSVNEGDGTFDITLRRTGGSDGGVSVVLRRTGGTATNLVDMNFRPATVIFEDGETEKTITRSLIDDTNIEQTETATFEITTPRGGVTLGANRNATLSIIDNDGPTVSPRLSPDGSSKQATIFVNNNTIFGNAFFAGDPYQGALFSSTDDSGNAADVILGTSGSDNIWAGTQGDDLIDAGAGADIVGIGNGSVLVLTGAGDDFVYAIGRGSGLNRIDLGSGNNNFYSQDGDNFVIAAGGDDVIGMGAGKDEVTVGDGNNIIYMIDPTGMSGRKTVITGDGDDYIQTGSSGDLLNGGGGFNSLFGGAGSDTFVATAGAYNFIGDFEFGSDRISLRNTTFEELTFFQGSTAAGNASTTYIFSNNTELGEVANSTVAALNNAANFM